MSGGEAIYQRLCRARNLDAAVSRLSCEELAEVALTLSGMSPTGGVPAQIFGMISARLAAGDRRGEDKRQKTGGRKS